MSDTTLTPKALAEEIGCDPKSLRGFLRAEYPRIKEAKNTAWIISADAADAAREHFAKQRTDADTRLDYDTAVAEAFAPEA